VQLWGFLNKYKGVYFRSYKKIILKILDNPFTTIMLVTHDAKVAAKTERVLFMMDGVIAGEKRLGKCQKNSDMKMRESQLSTWLSQMGF